MVKMVKMSFSSAAVVMFVGGVVAGDMQIDFPGLVLRAPAAATAAAASSTNLQTFTGALGGITADAVTTTGDAQKPFAVAGDTFSDFSTAATRSCNNQHNACASAANSSGDKSLTVGQCDTQQTSCYAAISNGAAAASSAIAGAATSTSIAPPTFKTADANFFYFCDA